MLDFFAAKAMQGMMSWTSGEGDCYDPKKTDADFTLDNAGFWYKSASGSWWCATAATRINPETHGKPHRMVTSYEYRLARGAYEIADAMLTVKKEWER